METRETGTVAPDSGTLPAVRDAEPMLPAEPDAYALTPAALGERLKAEGEKRKLLMDYIRAHLVAGTDYGMIHRWIGPKGSKAKCPNDGKHLLDAKGNPATCPACGAKHSLWKPGAEKIGGLLHVTATYSVDAETMTALAMTGKGVAYSCHLVSLQTGAILAEGRGAATLDGDYNKAIKMAKKSAMIDSTLGLAGLSSLFTQDVEDLKGQALAKYEGLAEELGARFDASAGAADTASSGVGAGTPEGGPNAPQEPAPADLVCPKCGKPVVNQIGKTSKAGKKLPAFKCSASRYNRETKKTEGCDWVEWDEKFFEKVVGAAKAEDNARNATSLSSQAAAPTDATGADKSAEAKPTTDGEAERQKSAPDLPDQIDGHQVAELTTVFRNAKLTHGAVKKLLYSHFKVYELSELTYDNAKALLAEYQRADTKPEDVSGLVKEIEDWHFDGKLKTDALQLHLRQLGIDAGAWQAAPANFIRLLWERCKTSVESGK